MTTPTFTLAPPMARCEVCGLREPRWKENALAGTVASLCDECKRAIETNPCHVCKGERLIYPVPCEEDGCMNGTVLYAVSQDPQDGMDEWPCDTCGGEGQVEAPCPHCDGCGIGGPCQYPNTCPGKCGTMPVVSEVCACCGEPWCHDLGIWCFECEWAARAKVER